MKKAFFGSLLISAMLIALVVWVRNFSQADTGYVPRIATRMWPSGGPVVAIDDAHWNEYTATRGYVPFAKLLQEDGYVVVTRGNVASANVLASAKVVVIANALGFRGVIRQVGRLAKMNLEGLAADAFSDAEVAALESWVSNGGSLLLVADSTPAGRAVQSLAERFGVTMRDRMVFDPDHADRGETSNIVFTQASRTIGSHQLIGPPGRPASVDRVVTFDGQALEGPPHAVKLLMFSGTAYETTWPNPGPDARTPVPGLAQALLLYHGKGRVVVLGDAELLTSRIQNPTGMAERIGLQWAGSDNEQFVRRIMGWLSGAVE
jgi:hypothetical protein